MTDALRSTAPSHLLRDLGLTAAVNPPPIRHGRPSSRAAVEDNQLTSFELVLRAKAETIASAC